VRAEPDDPPTEARDAPRRWLTAAVTESQGQTLAVFILVRSRTRAPSQEALLSYSLYRTTT